MGEMEVYKKDEFGPLIRGLETLAELSGSGWNRLEPTVIDLFEL